MSTELPRYILITPARNEAPFIGMTIESVLAQTHRPAKWIIVSDGSTDGTNEIVEPYAAAHDWIELVKLPERTQRHFAGKAAAFNQGSSRIGDTPYEVIGNLDADVTFEPDYLKFLMRKFAESPRLGVAGTPYREDNMMYDERFKSPDHVSGACQLFRRECFEAIGGYPLIRTGGIDFIALLKAQAAGWETRRFEEKFCWHHRSVGSGLHGRVYQRLLNHGKMDYLLGSHPVFEVFRTALQMRRRPYLIGGTLMLAGYVWAMLRRMERSVPQPLIELRQREQIKRLKGVLRHPLKYGSGLNHPVHGTAQSGQ
ncbi:MAG: glycosyltransferase family 2 protein [Vicinamibacterales bacterium]